MTNATVDQTVAAMTVKHPGQVQGRREESLVSPETPVVTYVPGDKSDLKPGAKVIAFG